MDIPLIIFIITVAAAQSNDRQDKVWSPWLRCNVPCGKGWQSRVCLMGADACKGRFTQRRKCDAGPCQTTADIAVDGVWSSWRPFSRCRLISLMDECSGVKRRIRSCDSPRPQNGGSYCSGYNSEVRPCNLCTQR